MCCTVHRFEHGFKTEYNIQHSGGRFMMRH